MNIVKERTAVNTYSKLSKIPLGSIVAKGWLRDQLLRSKEGMGGHLDELEPNMIAGPFINYTAFKTLPFIEGECDPTFAAGWSTEISGTYWTGLVQLAFTLNDAELIAKADKWISGVLKHQEADGYLGGYPENTDRNADYNSWGSAWGYRAMLAYYEATGKQEVLDAVHKGLLWFCDHWKDHKTNYVGSIIIEAMIIVYAYTGDRRLVDFSEDYLQWLEDKSEWQNKISQYLSDDLPYTAMHVVAYGENVKHPAIVYCATGNEKYLKASVKGMKKALDKIVQATGGPSCNNEYLSPKGAVCETEYCNFSTFNHSYYWLGMATGDASWADEAERCLFNGAEGARKKDERAIAYFTAPNQLHANRRSAQFSGQPDMGAYAPCFYVACCPTQSVRIIPEYIRSMCMKDDNNELYLFCYGPASVKTDSISFEMDTLYPFREDINIKITEGKSNNLHVRIPEWCKDYQITLNGKSVSAAVDEHGFALIDSALEAGDELKLHFTMEIEMIRIDDSAQSSKFPICIQRGPLVYALPVKTKWTPYAGSPITPLPEGWSWYEANPETENKELEPLYVEYQKASWSKAISPDLDVSRIKVNEHDIEGYVWENPPVTLEVPLYPVRNAYVCVTDKTFESYDVPLKPAADEEMCTMVPHGCTNLRITFLPRASK